MSNESFRGRSFVSIGPSFKSTGESFDSIGESFVAVGPSWKNCGQSQGQAAALRSDQAFQKAVTAQYETVAGENEAILGDLTGNLEQIFNQGPNQQGMSPAELAVQNSQAINSAAAANKQVQQVIGEKAGVSGATPGVESGVVQAERATAATQVENNLSNQEAAITQKNYDIGRENYNTATKELMAAPSALENPVTESASAVNTSNKDTQDQANANAAANQQWEGLAMGVLSDASGAFGAFEGAKGK